MRSCIKYTFSNRVLQRLSWLCTVSTTDTAASTAATTQSIHLHKHFLSFLRTKWHYFLHLGLCFTYKIIECLSGETSLFPSLASLILNIHSARTKVSTLEIDEDFLFCSEIMDLAFFFLKKKNLFIQYSPCN